MRAVEKAGYEPGKDIMFAMDAAASELYDAEKDCYDFTGEDVCRSSDELIDYYEALCKKYPIVSNRGRSSMKRTGRAGNV